MVEEAISLWPLCGTIPVSSLDEEMLKEIRRQNEELLEYVGISAYAMNGPEV